MMDEREVIALLRGFDLFAHFDDEQLRLLAFVSDVRALAPGDTLYSAGDPADGGYALAHGRLAASDDLTGPEKSYDIAPPALIGELGLMLTRPRAATITAATRARLVFVPRDPFLKLLRANPDLARAVAHALQDELRRYLDSIAQIAPRFAKE